MGMEPLPCLVCGKTIAPVFPDTTLTDPGEPAQPVDAVMFFSYGQYGSTVFDPQDESKLYINLCDPCLLERRDRVWHCRHVKQRALTLFSHPWDPGQEPG